MDVDGYLLDEGWTADIRLPWENLAEPELRTPHAYRRPASVHRPHLSRARDRRTLSYPCAAA